jgi:NADPH:quinone reductase-like Zn-dependent oxidoreductase
VLAAVLHTLGQPPAYQEHPTPSAGPGTTLVRVTAAPLVPLDLLCASGTSYLGRPRTPYVPGVQGVGVVEESQVVAAGSRVWFATSAGMAPGDGALGEWCRVPDGDVVVLDADVADPVAAAVGLSGVAAWMALSWRAGLQPGETVLVLGGGGAVGQAGIGAARALGARRVVAVARSEEAQRRASDAGAHVVVPLVSHVDELADRLRTATGGAVDVVLDPVFGDAATAAARVLAHGGRLVNLGGAAGDEARFSSALLRGRSAAVLGYTNNALTPDQRRGALTSVLGLAAEGLLTVGHETVPLSEVEEAWQRQADGRAASRQVLVPTSSQLAGT